MDTLIQDACTLCDHYPVTKLWTLDGLPIYIYYTLEDESLKLYCGLMVAVHADMVDESESTWKRHIVTQLPVNSGCCNLHSSSIFV